MISIYYIVELFKQNNDKTKVDNIPLAAGKSNMFSIGCLKFLDDFNFLAMPLDQMANIYHCKTKTLYEFEHFGLDSYQEIISNLNIEDFESSLINHQHRKKSISLIKTTVIKLKRSNYTVFTE